MRRYLSSSQLPEIVELNLDELRLLMVSGVFPPPRGCEGWNETKVRAWTWGLRNSPKLAKRVELVLGYRHDWWAKPTADLPSAPERMDAEMRSASDRTNPEPYVRRFYSADPIPALYALVEDMPTALGLTRAQFEVVARNDWAFPPILCTPTGWACRAGTFERWRAAQTKADILELIEMFGEDE